MAIGVIWSPPIDQQAYDSVREKVMPASVDKGLRFHAAGSGSEGWRIIEVWESREGLDRFIQEDLAAAFDEQGGGGPPQPDAVFDLHFQGP